MSSGKSFQVFFLFPEVLPKILTVTIRSYEIQSECSSRKSIKLPRNLEDLSKVCPKKSWDVSSKKIEIVSENFRNYPPKNLPEVHSEIFLESFRKKSSGSFSNKFCRCLFGKGICLVLCEGFFYKFHPDFSDDFSRIL